jgi:hypothetical protein
MMALVGSVLGAVAASGIWLTAAGVRGAAVAPPDRPPPDRSRTRGRVVAAGAALVVVWAASGWPSAGLVAASATLIVPGLVEVRQQRARSLARTDGLAGWAEMLRDTIASHAGLREAIAVTAEVAPEVIRPEVRRLAARAEHLSLSSGLRRFAAEVDDPAADLIVAALTVAADGQARDLPALLSGIAQATRAEAGMRVRVETGRARTYSSSRALVAITFTLSVSLLVFAPEFMAPYHTPWGQVMLAIIGGLFTAALVGLVALGRPVATPRLLSGVTERWGIDR